MKKCSRLYKQYLSKKMLEPSKKASKNISENTKYLKNGKNFRVNF